MLQEGLQDGTYRLGWTIEQSHNHLQRQIKGRHQGLPLMF